MIRQVSHLDQIVSAKRYALLDGEEKGLEVLDCNNGKLRFTLNVTKALDVMQVYHKGTNVSFVSKNGFSARETEFSTRFEGGMLYTVGLDNAGNREGYEMHGSIHNTPAKVLKVSCDDENGIEIVAEIRDTALFGRNLKLVRTVKSAVNSDSVAIHDELFNDGYRDEKYCLLYHVNVGYPMIDSGAVVQYNPSIVLPRNEWSKKKQDGIYEITRPFDNQEETCYFVRMKKPQAKVTNEKLGKEFTLDYSQETLPYFIEWKSMASGDYALGFEPTTTLLDGDFKYKTVLKGESVTFDVKLTVKDL